ncbi:PAS domain-containing protein [Dongia deserti]|uniref:hypothetical protein n=1 Tax=Dongia deserti TaxID=2268030 RepID=UPI0013C4AC3E|nr:hypothetical protein [Dongia deserti]
MHISRRTLIGPDGSLLGIGEKLSVVEGLGRVSNETRRAFELWRQAGQAHGLLKLADFSLEPISDLMPNMLMVEVLEAAHDYRYRYCGQREMDVRGEDPTGRTVRQCHQGEILDFVLENYDRVVTAGDGLLDLSVDINSSKRFIATEVLFLPFSDVGVAVTDILVYSHYLDTRPGALPVG